MPDDQASPPPLLPGSEARATSIRPIARWRWGVHLLLIAAYPLWIGLLSLGHEGEDHAPALASTAWGLVIVSLVGLVLFAVQFGGAWLASRASSDALLLHWRRGFWPVPWGIGYSIALRLGVGLVVAMIGVALVVLQIMTPDELQSFTLGNGPDVGALVDVAALRDDPVYFWLMITLVSFVVAGLREELWRAAFFAGICALWPSRFATHGAQIGAMALAAVVFGFGHAAQGPVAATMAGSIGFGLGVIMLVHRSIWPAVLAHGFFDATSFALIPYAMEQMRELQQAIPQ